MSYQVNSGARLPSSEIVLVRPCDIPIPPEATESLGSMAKLAEDFFLKWLNHWGYPPGRQEIFSRGQNGQILVRMVSGKERASSGAYDTPAALKRNWPQTEIVEEVVTKYSIPRNGNYFWIFVWLGPDRKFGDWNGSGGPRRGGRCVVRYTDGGEFPRPKSHIHEFGHAFGLPHVGPGGEKARDCNLMGPNESCYRNKMGFDYDNFYLTCAEAAMLWKHPVFSGTVGNRETIPRVGLLEFVPRFERCAETISVTGGLQTDLPCHSVVVVDEADGVGEYWRKAYASRVGADGSFGVCVSEPTKCCGRLRILPCFENGVNTGDGKHHGLCSAINKNYHWVDGKYEFEG